jgi:transcriptional regulator NrdR family protein
MKPEDAKGGSTFPCPCGHDHATTTDSRPTEGGVRRRRRCLTCQECFTTFEMIQPKNMLIRARRARAMMVQAVDCLDAAIKGEEAEEAAMEPAVAS